jgi:hypothetical protein
VAVLVITLAVVLLAGPVLLLMALTAVGERKRGGRPVTAVVAGLFFPVTWTAWYVRDEPYGPPQLKECDPNRPDATNTIRAR